jgi:SPP1 family predicted phage head-tail adaptor
MQPGELREVIELQKRGDLTDEYGNTTPGAGPYETQFSCPARIHILRGTETVIASRLAGTQIVAITVRWQPAWEDVAPDWRIVNGRTGVTYNIRSVEPDERRSWVNILAESGVAGA